MVDDAGPQGGTLPAAAPAALTLRVPATSQGPRVTYSPP